MIVPRAINKPKGMVCKGCFVIEVDRFSCLLLCAIELGWTGAVPTIKNISLKHMGKQSSQICIIRVDFEARLRILA